MGCLPTCTSSPWRKGIGENGKLGEQACFTVFFRDAPFKGGFAIACGMSQLAEMIDGFEFTESDIEYLAGLNAPGGGKLLQGGVALNTFRP